MTWVQKIATMVCGLALMNASSWGAPHLGLQISQTQIQLQTGQQAWCFTRLGDRWALDCVEVGGKPTVRTAARSDSFFVGGGEATDFVILTNAADEKAIQFNLGASQIIYSAQAKERIPVVRIRIEGAPTATCAYRAESSAADEHGAWVTRGYVATDADGHEDFVDASNPVVFGHSRGRNLDAAYLFLPAVNEHIQGNGRSEQRTDTWFKSARVEVAPGKFAGEWRLRLGRNEPKQYSVLFDRDLGGRFSDVCEKYYAGVVDTLIDLAAVPRSDFDPERCWQVMPLRLASPEAFIPGWGWMMDEFPKASYPFAHDCVWQIPALLAFEGLATRRAWEHNFARYFLDRTPLEGPDGKSYFVRRPGGLTRWGYFATYRDGFRRLDGGTWWQADMLYRTAIALGDTKLRQAARDMVLHDLNVKLDLDRMLYPPCWDAVNNQRSDDHRDDWFMTPGLAYCASMAVQVAYPETKDTRYLAIADRICDWFAGYLGPESKLNFLQGNNMHAVFSHYLTLAFLDQFDRRHDRQFLDLARDMAWVHIMTTCTTSARDAHGQPLTGVTCVGVRNCVDYDCTPNLCHEKDLSFVHIIGPLLDHVGGPAYGKYLALHRLTLGRDAWKSAWACDLRDTNLRTMYDTYARGMANLIYTLNPSSDLGVVSVDKLVSKSDTNLTQGREVILANGTMQERATTVRLRFLRPGTYEVKLDRKSLGAKSHRTLAEGLCVTVPPNTTRQLVAKPVRWESPEIAPPANFDQSTTFLSETKPFAAQRGTGAPQPTYRNDRGFEGGGIRLAGKLFDKGLGCAANTVLVYELNGEFDRFQTLVGVDDAVKNRTNPPATVCFTVQVDGQLRFESGPMSAESSPREVEVDVRKAKMLMLRMSGNWDDHGNIRNDLGDWAQARLVGRKSVRPR